MTLIGPLNQRGDEPAAGQMPVVRYRDAPGKATTRHRARRPEIERTRTPGSLDVRGACNPMDQPRAFGQRRAHIWRIELEPARAARCDSGRIDRDQLQVDALHGELEHAVVGAHRDVLATALRPYAKLRFDVILALVQCRRRQHEVVERGLRYWHARGEVLWTPGSYAAGCSSAAKSSSTLAPLGSKKNTCHTPELTCLR